MYSMTDERLRLLEEKLKITERLLEIEKAQHGVTKIQLDGARKSHRLQQTNTKTFFEQARAAEAKLKEIKAVLTAHQEQLPRSTRYARIREVLNGE